MILAQKYQGDIDKQKLINELGTMTDVRNYVENLSNPPHNCKVEN